MSAPAIPVSDELAVHRLLHVQDQLGDLLGMVRPGDALLVDAVLVALDSALTRLGYQCPEGPDGEYLWGSARPAS